MKKEKYDIETDLKTLPIHEPSCEFASKVTMMALEQAEKKTHVQPWMKWIPTFCIVGFVSLFVVFVFLVLQYLLIEQIHANTIMVLKGIAFIGASYFSFLLLDRFLRQAIMQVK